MQFNRTIIPWSHTAYGDGLYPVEKNGEKVGTFAVDAGFFAIFPIEFVKRYAKNLLKSKNLFTIVEGEGEIEVNSGNMKWNGVNSMVTVITGDHESDCTCESCQESD